MADDFNFDNSVSSAFATIGNQTNYAEMNKGIQAAFFIEDSRRGGYGSGGDAQGAPA